MEIVEGIDRRDLIKDGLDRRNTQGIPGLQIGALLKNAKRFLLIGSSLEGFITRELVEEIKKLVTRAISKLGEGPIRPFIGGDGRPI